MSLEFVALSAPTREGLTKLAREWVDHLCGVAHYFELADLAHTTTSEQEHGPFRLAVWDADFACACGTLERFLAGEPGDYEEGDAGAPPEVTGVVTSGDRAAWTGVPELLAGRPLFDELSLAADAWCTKHGADRERAETFTLQVGLARLWEEWGVPLDSLVAGDAGAVAAVDYLRGDGSLLEALATATEPAGDAATPAPPPAGGGPTLVVGPPVDGLGDALPSIAPGEPVRDTMVRSLGGLFARGAEPTGRHVTGRRVRVPCIVWPDPESAPASVNGNGNGAGDGRVEEVRRWLREELARAAGAEPGAVPLERPLGNLGIDSLRLVELRAAAEERWSVSLPLSELSGLPGEQLAEALADPEAHELAEAVTLDGTHRNGDDPSGPFPLTEIQGAYLAGRSTRLPLGGVMCHVYFEVEADELDVDRLTAAVRAVVTRHDMLRTVVSARGSQSTLHDVPPYEVERVELHASDDDEHRRLVLHERDRISHRVSDPESWPHFAVRALVSEGRPAVVQFSFDMLSVDADSIRVIGEELSALYADPGASLPAPSATFAQHARAQSAARTGPAAERSWRYWRERLQDLPPPPALPLRRALEPGDAPRFSRRARSLDPAAWRTLQEAARMRGMTASGLLCSAFSEVLRRFSERRDFVITLTTSTRYDSAGDTARTVGEYTSPLLLEVDGRGDSFAERAVGLQERMWSDLEHGRTSSIALLRELGRLRPGITPIAPVVFTSFLGQTAGSGRPSLFDAYGALGRASFALTQTPQVYLDHQAWESDGRLELAWDAVDDLFPPGLIDAMFHAYGELLELLVDDPAAWDRAGDSLAGTPARGDWPPQPALPEPCLLHERLDEQCRTRPDEVAVVAGDVRLTYGRLDATANALAHELLAAGAGPNRLVGLILPKGWEQVAATLAVLRAGAAYLPIDPDLPPKRIRHLLEHGEVETVVVRPDVERCWSSELTEVLVDVAPVDGPVDPVPACRALPSDLAYVIFTSGSTGQPKGVMIAHAAAANTLHDLEDRYRVGAGDAVLGLSALNFDLSVFDVFGVLGAGGKLVLPTGADASQPAAWQALLESEHVTIWNTVPALMTALVDHLDARDGRIPESLRLVMMSGDWIPVTLPDRIRARAAGAPELYSLGGATEASIWSIHYPIGEVPPEWPSIPYGRALAGQGVHVLDESLEPCPTWVPGDLYISGNGVAEGYWGDRERTDAAFIRHPVHGTRLYRTGDRGRYLGDGEIEFLGRLDGQVKINGFRIELGEVEATLARHPGVAAAIAQALDSPRGRRVLAAYVVPAPAANPTDDELRAHVGEFLPSYMRPAAYVRLDEMPLTANGKLDRSALPLPWDGAGESESEHREQDGALVELIKEVLAFDELDLDADFGELSIDSLDLIAVIDAVQLRWGVEVTLADVNDCESPRDLLDAVAPLLPADPRAPAEALA